MTFVIGQRVRMIAHTDYHKAKSLGTVVHIRNDDDKPIGVQFDDSEWDDMHKLGSLIPDATGWWCTENSLELVDPNASFPIKWVPKIGDRVRMTGDSDGSIYKGFGTIRDISSDPSLVGVEFDDMQSGMHNLDGRLKTKNGWWCYATKLVCEVPVAPISEINGMKVNDVVCMALPITGQVMTKAFLGSEPPVVGEPGKIVGFYNSTEAIFQSDLFPEQQVILPVTAIKKVEMGTLLFTGEFRLKVLPCPSCSDEAKNLMTFGLIQVGEIFKIAPRLSPKFDLTKRRVIHRGSPIGICHSHLEEVVMAAILSKAVLDGVKRMPRNEVTDVFEMMKVVTGTNTPKGVVSDQEHRATQAKELAERRRIACAQFFRRQVNDLGTCPTCSKGTGGPALTLVGFNAIYPKGIGSCLDVVLECPKGHRIPPIVAESVDPRQYS